ncbi:MAG: hypothetical protein GX187_01980 [Clostridiaceae bacterium]|nr:hypothetical protein [Clostridiaceae bacterium]
MAKFMKKHSAAIVLLVNIILLVVLMLWLQNSIKAASFALEDLFGQRDYINGICITGSLHDTGHSLEFSLEDGKISTRTIVYDTYSDYLDQIRYYPYNWSLIDNKNTEVLASITDRISDTAETIVQKQEFNTGEFSEYGEDVILKTTIYADEVDYYCNISLFDDLFKKAIFKTGISRKSDRKEFMFEEERVYIKKENEMIPIYSSQGGASAYNHKIYPKVVKIGEKYYVTITTNEFCIGSGGIYRIDGFEHFNYEKDLVGKVTKIVDVDLKGGKLKVIGLEPVSDKLLLLLIDNNKLVVQLYDTDGNFLDELKPDIPEVRGDGQYGNSYFCFINGKNAHIVINSESKLISDNFSIVSLSVEEKLKLNHTLINFRTKSGRNQEFFAVESVDDKLIIINGVYEIGINADDIYSHAPEIQINIFDKSGELKYQGRLLTDMKDDYEILSVPYHVKHTYTIRHFDIFNIKKSNY